MNKSIFDSLKHSGSMQYLLLWKVPSGMRDKHGTSTPLNLIHCSILNYSILIPVNLKMITSIAENNNKTSVIGRRGFLNQYNRTRVNNQQLLTFRFLIMIWLYLQFSFRFLTLSISCSTEDRQLRSRFKMRSRWLDLPSIRETVPLLSLKVRAKKDH